MFTSAHKRLAIAKRYYTSCPIKFTIYLLTYYLMSSRHLFLTVIRIGYYPDNKLSGSRIPIHLARKLYLIRKRYGHGGRVHEIKITDTAEITIAGTNPNPEP